jgi:hypothetical protein
MPCRYYQVIELCKAFEERKSPVLFSTLVLVFWQVLENFIKNKDPM